MCIRDRVNIDELLLSQPDSGEQGLEIAGKLIDSGAVDLVVVDSVAALVPRAEIDGDIGDSHVGLQARMMSQAMRKLGASINKTKTIAIFINQLREKDVYKRQKLDGEEHSTFPELEYFGQMHGTYLFAQGNGGLYIIDQHAAQERVKYEEYRESIGAVSYTHLDVYKRQMVMFWP